jgi:hypothetical protein
VFKLADALTVASKFIPGILMIVSILVIGGVVLGITYWLAVLRRRRKWSIEVHELKTDGRLHTVGKDELIEIKKKMGTITYYWLKKAKSEAIPPPSEIVDRFKGKEEVDYVRIERDLIPADKKVKNPLFYDKKYRNKLEEMYDKCLNSIKSIKTTFFDSEAVRDRWMYIPMNKTLVANVEFKPIPFDMNMMAANQINNADQQYASQYEWWKKYGAIIVFGATIIFLIIVAVLTFDYMQGVANAVSGKLSAMNELLAKSFEAIGGKPPS